jgi:hypothetical protein
LPEKVLDFLRDAQRRMVKRDGITFYEDSDHLSVAGAFYVKPKFDAVFKQIQERHRRKEKSAMNLALSPIS